jgi:hypothetical protein
VVPTLVIGASGRAPTWLGRSVIAIVPLLGEAGVAGNDAAAKPAKCTSRRLGMKNSGSRRQPAISRA